MPASSSFLKLDPLNNLINIMKILISTHKYLFLIAHSHWNNKTKRKGLGTWHLLIIKIKWSRLQPWLSQSQGHHNGWSDAWILPKVQCLMIHWKLQQNCTRSSMFSSWSYALGKVANVAWISFWGQTCRDIREDGIIRRAPRYVEKPWEIN